MTDRAITRYHLPAAMKATGDDWRSQLHHYAHATRQAFLANPILCDLLLIRSTMSTKAGAMGAKEIERIVALLMAEGLSLEDAYDSYSAVQLHLRGSIVLERLYQRSKAEDSGTVAYYENLVITPEDTRGWPRPSPNVAGWRAPPTTTTSNTCWAASSTTPPGSSPTVRRCHEGHRVMTDTVESIYDLFTLLGFREWTDENGSVVVELPVARTSPITPVPFRADSSLPSSTPSRAGP